MSFKKALSKLEKLPPNERQLAAGRYVWEVKDGKSHCGCAIGKLLTEKQRVKLFKNGVNTSGIDDLLTSFLKGTVPGDDGWTGQETESGILDLTYGEANDLQNENDGFFMPGTRRNSYADRKARYKYVVGWLKEKIAEVIALSSFSVPAES